MKNMKRRKHITLTLFILLYSCITFAQVGPITGATSLCPGTTTTLSDTTSGGVWASSSVVIVTIGSSTGIVTGVSAGTATITYTAGAVYATTTVTVNAPPTAFTVTGGGPYCAGGTGVPVGLNNSAAGINYQLFVGGTPIGLPVSGSGAAITFGSQVAAGTYTATATDAATGCTGSMAGSVAVSVNPLPPLHNVTGGGGYCAGGMGTSVGLDGSNTGINYLLYHSGSPVSSPVPGSGALINFGPQTAVGAYTVVATNAVTTCTVNMTGSVTVSVNPLPTLYSVSAGSYCAGGAGSDITLSSSDAGTTYVLDSSGIPIVTLPGTGTSLDFGTHLSGPYSVIATSSAGCTASMGAATVMVSPLPTAYTVTGGGSYCFGGTGMHVGLLSSNVGISYQLYKGAIPVGSVMSGFGGPIDFGLQTIAATYTVIATNTTTGCSNHMVGSAVISIAPLPAAITGTLNACPGNTRTLFDPTPGGSWSSSSPAIATIGTAGTVTGISAGTTVISYTSGICTATTTFTVNSLPTLHNVTGGGTYCTGGTGVDVALNGSDIGISYQLYNGSTATGTPLSGLGGILDFGPQTATGTYTVKATSLATGCSDYMSGSVVVGTVSPPALYTVTGGGAYCPSGTGVHVSLSGSQSGIIYQLILAGLPVGSAVTGSGLAIDFGPQTAAGSYTVVANNGTCIVNMAGTAYVSISALPSVNAVSGGGSFCSGGIGVPINLSGSQTGTTYHLFNGSTLVDTLLGTGSALDFGSFTSAGTYTVTATSLSTGCSANMTGSATVVVNPLPSVYTVTGGGSYCAGGTGVHIGLTGSNSGVSYQLYTGGFPTGAPVAGTSSAIDFGLRDTAGTYTAIATNTTTACINYMAGSSLVIITPTVTPTVSISSSPGDTICAGAAVMFTAVPVNGGATPVYHWSVNGVPVVIGTTYTYLPLNGDIVGVTMNSSATCATPLTVSSTATVTAKPHPVITGDTVICLGSSTILTSATGSTWGSSDPLVATIATVGGSTGVVTPLSAGTTVITCILSGCITTATLTVNPLPAVTLSSTRSCGGISTLTAGGAATYSWSPASGLSCTLCSATNADPSVTTVYTVTGTIATGCSDTASVRIDANLISGYISYGSSPHDSFRVYLYHFNSADTSLIVEDSALSCLSAGTPYYEFEYMPAGDYMVQARLIGQVPGTTGNVPTFSAQTAYWNSAASVAHTNAKDTMHINMVYGTVPAGPGFIGGYISTTSSTAGFVPAPGLLVLLLDGISGSVITFTYTDASGNYSFSNIAAGNYIVYPEQFGYHTTESAVVALSGTADSATNVGFRVYTASRIIIPYNPSVGVKEIDQHTGLVVYPNPTSGLLYVRWDNLATGRANVIISDMVGREVYHTDIDINTLQGETQIDPGSLKEGIYLLSVKSGYLNYSGKLVIAK